MKTQILLVMAAMLVTVFVIIPTASLTLVVNVGILALLLTTLNSLAGTAIHLHLENKWRVHSKKIVVKDTDGKLTKAS